MNAAELPTLEGLLEEEPLFLRSLAAADARKRMTRFLESGGQTREVGLDFHNLVQKLSH